MKSSVHEHHESQHGRVLERIRDRYAYLRRDLIEWATRSKTRLKTLHAAASRSNIGMMYHHLEDALGVTRRWCKELIGELRDLGVVRTESNPAVIEIDDRKLQLLVIDILETLLPSENNDRRGRVRPTAGSDAPDRGGPSAPSGDSPPGESPLRGGGGPPLIR